MRKKNILITTIGSLDCISSWLCKTRNFDVALIYYPKEIKPDVKKRLESYADFVFYQEGFKYEVIQKIIRENPELLEYDYYWMPDDDVFLKKGNVNFLFDQAKKYQLGLSQPSTTKENASWKLLRHQRGYEIRYSNFIEVMCPLFSLKSLKTCLKSFSYSKSGWGLDILWSSLISEKIGIIDSAVVRHTKKIDLEKGTLYQKLLQETGKTPKEELKLIRFQHDLTYKPEVYSYVYKKKSFIGFWKKAIHKYHSKQKGHCQMSQDKTSETAPKKRGGSKFSYNTYVSSKHKYFYMASGKVACSKIKMTLHELEGYLVPIDPSIVQHRKEEGREFVKNLLDFDKKECVEILSSKDWFRFCFVRNPYYRLFSAYKSKFQKLSDPQYNWLKDKIREKYDYPVRNGHPAGIVAFRDFVKYLQEEPKVLSDGHWNVQTSHLSFGAIPYDFIGRVENFTEDFQYVLTKLNASDDLIARVAERVNTTPQVYHAAAYDKELADSVYELYEEDFENFGYDRDSWLFDFEGKNEYPPIII